MAHTIDLPGNRVYNNNQYSDGIRAIAGESGCSIACLLNVANIFGPIPVSLQEVYAVCGWNSGGVVTWAIPSSCSGHIDASEYYSTHSESEIRTVIRQQVDSNNPVIVKLTNSQGETHFVTVYGYEASGTVDSQILTLDPAGAKLRTLAEAKAYCGKNTAVSYLIGVRD